MELHYDDSAQALAERDQDTQENEEQLTVEVPVEIRAGSTNKYPCCRRLA